MSYVRFTEEGSDVYIYEDVRGFVICCGCIFGGPEPADDFRTTVLDDMLAHVKRHRDAEHHVPAWVDADLRDQWPDFGGEEP